MLVNVPSRKEGFSIPLGLLYVGGIIERCGHKAKIVDMYVNDLKSLEENIKKFNPSIIGFGGIATSYGTTKKLSLYIKEHYPDIFQIAGGPLASAYELLLTKTKIDVVFHGETERSLPIFLKRFVNKKSAQDVLGISYLNSGKIIRNAPAEQIKNLDEIPRPAYHLVDINLYLTPIESIFTEYSILLKDPKYSYILKKAGQSFIQIMTSRGCTHRCFFCYRHVIGHRQHSVGYVINHIKYLMRTYGVTGFHFGDELFNCDPAWVSEFCDAIEKEKLNIFYIVGGARINMTDEKMLRRLKETGCIAIEYGQESGSDTVLKDYRKGVSREQNVKITKLTQKVGLLSVVQIVIGSPNETSKTIGETIEFLKDVNAFQFSVNYLIPLPETPSWKYAIDHDLIKDQEKYLDDAAKYGGKCLLVNLTKEPDRVVARWIERISYEMTKHYYKTTGRLQLYALYSIVGRGRIYLGQLIPTFVKETIGKFLKHYELKI